MSKPKAKRKSTPRGILVRLASLLDLVRLCSIDANGAPFHINAARDGAAGYRLFQPCEKVGETRMLYYFDAKSIEAFGVYAPGVEGYEESFAFSDAAATPQDYRFVKVPVLELSALPYDGKKGARGLPQVALAMAPDFDALARAVINDASMREEPARMYCFRSGKDRIAGTFDVIHENGTGVFTYSRIPYGAEYNTLNYDYATNRLEASNSITGKAHICIRLINLAEPFFFFRPE